MHAPPIGDRGGRASLKRFKCGIVAAITALSLGGCLSSNVTTYNSIDPTQRTMTVPGDPSVFANAIRVRLQRIGWQVVLDNDPAATPTRYRLLITQRHIENCYPKGGDEISYKLILYDNKTNDAVLTQGGRDCSDPASIKFVLAVRDSARR